MTDELISFPKKKIKKPIKYIKTMKEYTRDELIGNILICREGESYIIKLPSSNLPDKVNLNRIERVDFIQDYKIRYINIAINENKWTILPSEGIKNNYEIY